MLNPRNCSQVWWMWRKLISSWPSHYCACVSGDLCKMVHLNRVTPPSVASDALVSFDEDVRQCFVLCSAIEVSDSAWKQAQLGLRFGGLGLRSLSCHATSAAFIASLSSSGLGLSNNHHLQQAVVVYNSKVSLHHTITAESALASPTPERESCPAELIKISSNLCWRHLPQQTKPMPTSVRFSPSCSFMAVSGPHGVQ